MFLVQSQVSSCEDSIICGKFLLVFVEQPYLFLNLQFTLTSTAVAPYVYLDSGIIDGVFRYATLSEPQPYVSATMHALKLQTDCILYTLLQ